MGHTEQLIAARGSSDQSLRHSAGLCRIERCRERLSHDGGKIHLNALLAGYFLLRDARFRWRVLLDSGDKLFRCRAINMPGIMGLGMWCEGKIIVFCNFFVKVR